jgi:hypothetical protein
MRLILSLALSICLFTSASAQITITNKVVPVLGDSFAYALDTSVPFLALGFPAGDQVWDLSFLQNQGRRSEVYRDPALSPAYNSFPTANAMLRTNARETFYRLSANKVEELGFANRAGGPIPGFNQPNVYSKAVTVFNTPTTFGSTLNYKTDVTIPFPASFVPDSLLSQIPGPIKPDSFRIRLTTDVERLSDAWGKVKLPLKTWDVIREKVTTNTTFAIDARLGLLGWQDITAFAGAFVGGLIPTGKNVSYAFRSNESKGLIALVSTDTSGNVVSIQYKPNTTEVASRDLTAAAEQFELKNSIIQDNIQIICTNAETGNWQLNVFSNDGKNLYNQSVEVREGKVLDIDLKNLPQGSFQLLLVKPGTNNFWRSTFTRS